MTTTEYSIAGEIERLTEGCAILRPRPVRDRRGVWHRDPAGELDWFYALAPRERAYISRHYMAPTGVECDVLSTVSGFDSLYEWADALLAAIRGARGRTMSSSDVFSPQWEEAAEASWSDDDDELLGPDEVAALLSVKRNTLAQWRHREKLPEPYMTLSGLPIWRRGDVMAFAVDTGREVVEPE